MPISSNYLIIIARFIHDGSERNDKSKAEIVDVELTIENWERKTYLGVASLLAKACEAAMVGHLSMYLDGFLDDDIDDRDNRFYDDDNYAWG